MTLTKFFAAERIHKVEHVLYPKVLQLIAEGRMSVENNKVHISEEAQKGE